MTKSTKPEKPAAPAEELEITDVSATGGSCGCGDKSSDKDGCCTDKGDAKDGCCGGHGKAEKKDGCCSDKADAKDACCGGHGKAEKKHGCCSDKAEKKAGCCGHGKAHAGASAACCHSHTHKLHSNVRISPVLAGIVAAGCVGNYAAKDLPKGLARTALRVGSLATIIGAPIAAGCKMRPDVCIPEKRAELEVAAKEAAAKGESRCPVTPAEDGTYTIAGHRVPKYAPHLVAAGCIAAGTAIGSLVDRMAMGGLRRLGVKRPGLVYGLINAGLLGVAIAVDQK